MRIANWRGHNKVQQFKCLASVLREDEKWETEIRGRIWIAKDEFQQEKGRNQENSA